MTVRLLFTLCFLAAVSAPGCQAEGCPHGETCACTPESSGCTCQDGGDCDLACPDPACNPICVDVDTCAATCGDGCTFDCQRSSDCSLATGKDSSVFCSKVTSCEATCGESCRYFCQDAETCRVTAGPGSTLGCNRADRCEIFCEGSCIVDCGSVGSCEITCLGNDPITCDDGRPACGEGCYIP